MWPRDSFPEQSINLGVRGRFSTIGYDAKVLDGGQPKTIQNAAEAVMGYVRTDRPPVSPQVNDYASSVLINHGFSGL